MIKVIWKLFRILWTTKNYRSKGSRDEILDYKIAALKLVCVSLHFTELEAKLQFYVSQTCRQEAVNYTYFSRAELLLGADKPGWASPDFQSNTWTTLALLIRQWKLVSQNQLRFEQKIKKIFNKRSRKSKISVRKTVPRITFPSLEIRRCLLPLTGVKW